MTEPWKQPDWDNLSYEQKLYRLEPPGGNLYLPHMLMVHSGQFWRCKHGSTGYRPCLRCAVRHPIRALRYHGILPKGGAA